MSKLKGYIAILLLTVFTGTVAFYGGKTKGRKEVLWFSELMQRTSGRQVFLIDTHITCSNGKDLGVFQADFNITNGKLRIVRNDAGVEPNCNK